MIDAHEAAALGEEPLQMLELSRYEYRLTPLAGASPNLALLEKSGIQRNRAGSDLADSGIIEPGDYCGHLQLVVVRREDPDQLPLGLASVEVRSKKLGYREHYHAMISAISERAAGLLIDCRAPTSLSLRSVWNADSHIAEQQLEFLRHIIDGLPFRSAINQVLRDPHRRLEQEDEVQDTRRAVKPGRLLARQIGSATRRIGVPADHPLHGSVESIPARIASRRARDQLDTSENRFAKHVITEFHDFLAQIQQLIGRQPLERQIQNEVLFKTCTRLSSFLQTQLRRGLFPDVSPARALPLGSPVLQRKAGYRELLRCWLQFHAAAQISWDGAADVFQAGSRDIPALYEYWLFFQLEDLFRRRFDCDQPLYATVVDRAAIPPRLTLRRSVELKNPVEGTWSEIAGRRMRAEFAFNRTFSRSTDRARAGSWTVSARPDYTISIWPAEYSKQRAEELELMVHVHFDAKYRIDRVREILGEGTDEPSISDAPASTAAKNEDLLKMHSYRDAIRRTAGAYVLYPGVPGDGKLFTGYHEVLPGLGAFAVRPTEDGKAEGMADVAVFLDKVIEHLANRATARERVTYHVNESYRLSDAPVTLQNATSTEADSLFGSEYRMPPPAEHMVLAAWYRDPAQVDLARRADGIAFVRLGRRRGTLHVHPDISQTRHILLRSEKGEVADGLVRLREPGFRVYTRENLARLLRTSKATDVLRAWAGSLDDPEMIYAVFKTEADPDWAASSWDGPRVMEEIETFESDRRHAPVENLGRSSPNPRLLPMRSLQRALRI